MSEENKALHQFAQLVAECMHPGYKVDDPAGYDSSRFLINSKKFQFVPSAQKLWNRDYSELPLAQLSTKDLGTPWRANPCEEWWTIEAYGRDQVREIPAGETTVGFGNANTAGQLPASSQLIVGVNSDDPIFVDVGTGVRFSVLARVVNVGIYVPGTNVRENTGNRSAAPVQADAGSTVIDSIVTVRITCGDGPIGNRVSTVTRLYTDDQTDVPSALAQANGATTFMVGNDGAVAGDYLIPPRSRRVQFSTPEAPPLNTPIRFLDNPVDRNVVGTFFFDGSEAITRKIEIPQGSASIISTADVAVPVTATYELEL